MVISFTKEVESLRGRTLLIGGELLKSVLFTKIYVKLELSTKT